MLKAKPSERITIEDVMQHPWINQDINEIPENKIIMDENAMDYFTKKGKVNDAMTEALKHERLPEDQAFKVVEVNSLKNRMRNRKNRNQNKESNKRNLNETTRWFFGNWVFLDKTRSFEVIFWVKTRGLSCWWFEQ